jgi:uncharacterized protein HemX
MIELRPTNNGYTSNGDTSSGLTRIGRQPIALATAVLVVLVAGGASIALWRSYTGFSPESDRVVAVRQLQARTAQASEQLVEKTKGLEVTQQESIDQLQVVQDQLQTVRRLLAAQQTETKRLSEQVGSLTGAIDGLRQSFASTQTSEPSSPPSVRKSPVGKKRGAAPQRKRTKSGG